MSKKNLSLLMDGFMGEANQAELAKEQPKEKAVEQVAEQAEQPAAQDDSKHSKKCTFYTLRFGCSFAAVNTIKPQLL